MKYIFSPTGNEGMGTAPGDMNRTGSDANNSEKDHASSAAKVKF